MFSPCDSWHTPTCSDRNRDSPRIAPAIAWSIDAPPAPRPVYGVPDTSALIDLWCVLPGAVTRAFGLSTPLTTWMSSRIAASGARHGVNSYAAPVSVGIQYRSGMPLPLNQSTTRGWIAASAAGVAAYAVPFALNIAASGGRPTRIAAPVMLMFRRNRRLLSGMTLSPSNGDGLKPVPYG